MQLQELRGPERFSVNRILAPDGPIFHQHPYEFCWSLIVNGGYTHEFFYPGPNGEQVVDTRTFKVGDINFMPRPLHHRIAHVLPDTYTLFYKGPDLA